MSTRKLPPIWVMGLTNAAYGMYGGFAVVTVAEMLAAQGLPGDRIARVVSTILSPSVWIFLFAPVLDVKFRRRTYALFSAIAAAVCVAGCVLNRAHLGPLQVFGVCGMIAVSQLQNAVGGWTGALIGKEADSSLGAWFAVANTGAGGMMMVVGGEVIRSMSGWHAALTLAALMMLPCLLYLLIPAPLPDARLTESYRKFMGDIAALAKHRNVQLSLLLFLLPSASFAMTNVLGGVGADFRASEHMVSLFSGVGAAVAGTVSSLLVPLLAKRFALRPLYLGIGIAGGLFTLTLALMPHVPGVFALAITGENAFQALAFAAANALTFEAVGPGNPLASTLFAILLSCTNLSITYMGFIDAHAYALRGIRGSFLADAAISIAFCAALAVVLPRLTRRSLRMSLEVGTSG